MKRDFLQKRFRALIASQENQTPNSNNSEQNSQDEDKTQVLATKESPSESEAHQEPKATVTQIRSRFPKAKPNLKSSQRKLESSVLTLEKGEKGVHLQIDSEPNKQDEDKTEVLTTKESPSESEAHQEPKATVTKIRSRFPKAKPNLKSSQRKLEPSVLMAEKVEKGIQLQIDSEPNKQDEDKTEVLMTKESPSESEAHQESEASVTKLRSCFTESQPKSCDRKLGSGISAVEEEEKGVNAQLCSEPNKEDEDKTEVLTTKESPSESETHQEPKATVTKIRSRFPKAKPNFKSSQRKLESSVLMAEKVEKGVHLQLDSEPNKQDEDRTEVLTTKESPSESEAHQEPKATVTKIRSRFPKAKPNLKSSQRKLEPSVLMAEKVEKGVHLQIDSEPNKQDEGKTEVLMTKESPSESEAHQESEASVTKLRSCFTEPKPKSCDRKFSSSISAVEEEEKGVNAQFDRKRKQMLEDFRQLLTLKPLENNLVQKAAAAKPASDIGERAHCGHNGEESCKCASEDGNKTDTAPKSGVPGSPTSSMKKRHETLYVETLIAAGIRKAPCQQSSTESRHWEQNEKYIGETEVGTSSKTADSTDLLENCNDTSENQNENDTVPESSLGPRIGPGSPSTNLKMFDTTLHMGTVKDNERKQIDIQTDKQCQKPDEEDQAGLKASNASTSTVSVETDANPTDLTKHPLSKTVAVKTRTRLPKPNLTKFARKLSTCSSRNREGRQVHFQEDIQISSEKESICKSDNADKNVCVRPAEKSDSDSAVSSPKRKSDSRSSVELQGKRNKGRATTDKNSMTMHDLIYWNPAENPMQAPADNQTEETIQNDDAVDDRNENNIDCSTEKVTEPGEEVEDDLEEADDIDMPGPRVIITADGEIAVDRDTLEIPLTGSTEKLSAVIVVEDGNTTYSSFRSKQNSLGWSERETKKFYQALSTVGTDFTLMSQLFRNRSRRELKLKYKREEKLNRALVDNALDSPPVYNLEAFHHDEDGSVSDQNEARKKPRKSKKRCKKQKKIKVVDVEDDVIDIDIPQPKKAKRIRRACSEMRYEKPMSPEPWL